MIQDITNTTTNPTAEHLDFQQRLAEINQRLDQVTALAENDEPSNATTLLTKELVSIVIPVFNEEATIGTVLNRVAQLPLNSEIVIVDDCSTDGTREILAKLDGVQNIRIVLQDENQGKGAALRAGFAKATGEYVVVQDADLEYHPQDIPGLLEPLIRGECDIVYGSRFIGVEHQDKSLVHRLGNWALTFSSNLFNGVHLTDMETCYKAFRRSTLDGITIRQNRFGVEPELTAKWSRRGYRIQEVPISYNARSYEEGKKIGVRDLFQAIYCICRYGISD